MIDADLRFGSYVPKVPSLYKNAAALPTATSSPATDVNQKDKKYKELCAIGQAWMALPLLSVKKHNHDTSLFTFSLPDGVPDLNLPTMGHLLVRAPECEHKSAGGGDAIRPYTAVVETSGDDGNDGLDGVPGSFTVMVKLYREWGQPESELINNPGTKCFLFTKTDHSYRPPGAVSNYIHSLNIGDSLEFCFIPLCRGKVDYPSGFRDITAITMIAVGAGVAPMIRLLRVLLEGSKEKRCDHVKKIRLLYGARTADDILMRSTLDNWHEKYNGSGNGNGRFCVRYCVGSRWGNVHFHAKTKKSKRPTTSERI